MSHEHSDYTQFHAQTTSLTGLIIISTLFSNSLSPPYQVIPGIVVLCVVCSILAIPILLRYFEVGKKLWLMTGKTAKKSFDRCFFSGLPLKHTYIYIHAYVLHGRVLGHSIV